ncbi:MAG: hypothetical protein FWE20_12000 [Defluviitaleaceae bacterium]|nr:hypothetical protein [Defluviitaleaceae bacterium]
MSRVRCPCCGYFTHEEGLELFEICEVCGWQYNGVAHDKPDMSGGANKVSLNQARENLKEFGASELRFRSNMRAPMQEEMPNNNM